MAKRYASQILKDRTVIALRERILQKTNIIFTAYQYECSDYIIDSALKRNAKEYFLFFARQSGKTETLTITNLTLIIYFIYHLKEEYHIGIFSPAKSQAVFVSKDRLQRRYKKIERWLKKDLNIISNLGGDSRTTGNFYLYCESTEKESRIIALSADKVANIKAPTLHMIQLEQSEDMDSDKMQTDIFPMAASTGGLRVHAITSTISFKNNYAYKKLKTGEGKLPKSCDVTWREASKYPEALPRYATYMEEMKKDLGEESDAFKTQFNLEWILSNTKLIDWETLKDLRESYVSVPSALRFGGVDVGKENDSTVATVVERAGFGNHILGWLEREGTDYEVQADELADYFIQQKMHFIYVDKIGVGAPMADMLKKRLRGHCRVEGWAANPEGNNITGTQLERELRAKEPFRLYFPLAESREQRRFIDQLLDCEKVFTGNKLKLEHPSGRKFHDDYVKSLELALHASMRSAGKVASKTFDSTPKHTPTGSSQPERIDWEKWADKVGEWPTDSEDDDLEYGMRKRGRLIHR